MGSTLTIPEKRSPEEVCSLIEQYKVIVLPASPTFLNLILIGNCNLKFDLSSLKLITYGTEPMPEALLIKLRKSFKGVRFLQTFGTSETGIVKTQSKSSNSTLIKINDENQEYKIVDGELWLKSKTQILGYLNYSMENFSSDGWFKTGDLVEEEGDNYLKIVGRLNEIINVGGEKVLPVEVESILLQLPEIEECLVYKGYNAITGQMVVADVQLCGSNLEQHNIKKKIRRFCRENLDAYKIPVKINFVSKINTSTRFKKIRRKN